MLSPTSHPPFARIVECIPLGTRNPLPTYTQPVTPPGWCSSKPDAKGNHTQQTVLHNPGQFSTLTASITAQAHDLLHQTKLTRLDPVTRRASITGPLYLTQSTERIANFAKLADYTRLCLLGKDKRIWEFWKLQANDLPHRLWRTLTTFSMPYIRNLMLDIVGFKRALKDWPVNEQACISLRFFTPPLLKILLDAMYQPGHGLKMILGARGLIVGDKEGIAQYLDRKEVFKLLAELQRSDSQKGLRLALHPLYVVKDYISADSQAD